MKDISSFRDNSGFVFKQDDILFRQVNKNYKENYDHLMTSGLYLKLVSSNLMVSHLEVTHQTTDEQVYKVLQPQLIPFISYPYSWSFSMLKDAALLTLKIQQIALSYNMKLKDASAFNVQFIGSKPIFIDTLSFEIYKDGEPWKAYRQFCQHFFAPLALMAYTDISLNKLLVTNIDGIPLSLVAKLLPLKSRLNLGLFIHLFIHAKFYQKYSAEKVTNVNAKFNSRYFENLTSNLITTIESLKWKPKGTQWANYYHESVSKDYFDNKAKIVQDFLDKIKPNKVIDLGANDGTFSKLAANYAQNVFSFDVDNACVEKNYLRLKEEGNSIILPLIVDILNPDPGIGWNNQERISLLERMKADTTMALALIHHLCISNNIPFQYLASFFNDYCQNLIIEWIPKSDEKILRLLHNREDIFSEYTEKNFIDHFTNYFDIIESKTVVGTNRKLYYMSKK